MNCEGACAHANVRFAVARVRAKSLLIHVCDVRACGHFSRVRRVTAISHVLRFGPILMYLHLIILLCKESEEKLSRVAKEKKGENLTIEGWQREKG